MGPYDLTLCVFLGLLSMLWLQALYRMYRSTLLDANATRNRIMKQLTNIVNIRINLCFTKLIVIHILNAVFHL
jgi:hypothetical protein